ECAPLLHRGGLHESDARIHRRAVVPADRVGAIPDPAFAACGCFGAAGLQRASHAMGRSGSAGTVAEHRHAGHTVGAAGDVRRARPRSPWGERVRPSRQASLIVDPPDGRFPPMTPEGERRSREAYSTYFLDFPEAVTAHPFNEFSDLGIYDRCITRGLLASILP